MGGAITTREIRSSVENHWSNYECSAVKSFLDDQSTTQPAKDLLLWNVLARQAKRSNLLLPTVNSTTFPAVRFINKCLPFRDVDARFIHVLALARQMAEEKSPGGSKGLDPYLDASNMRA